MHIKSFLKANFAKVIILMGCTFFAFAFKVFPGVLEVQSAPSQINRTSDKPWNFVFILADDMGWNQTGYGGSDFYETPNIDAIAKDGMYFTNAYTAAPICSPSRAGILSGKYPARLHLTEYIPGDPYPWAKLRAPKEVNRLPLKEKTIAEVLNQKGYKSAMIGKWHLNKDKNYKLGRPGDPESQGFDFVHATVKPSYDANPNKDAHHTIELTNQSLQFLEKNKSKPFFLYLAYHAVHRPIMEHPDLIYKYQEKQGSDKDINNPTMGAMIERMDTQIGRILHKLGKLKLSDHTVVIFFSDNGGYNKLQAQDPLRGGKTFLYEGGIREPLAIRWPGIVKPGSRSSVPVIGVDFLPTIAQIAGINNLPKNIDGVSLVPILKQTGNLQQRDLYWHYPHYHRFGYLPSGAIREGDYKLIEWYERSYFDKDHPVSLFNIKKDISETNDLADQMPEKKKELWDKLKKWRKDVGAQKMTKNPNFDPKKALFWSPNVDPNSADALGHYH